MKVVIFRRRKLGRTSCREVAKLSKNNIEVIRNDLKVVPQNTDLVIRWGCTDNINGVKKVLNKVEAIHFVNNKIGFRKALSNTNLIPKTFFSIKEWMENKEQYSIVIFRPSRHAQGRNILKVHYSEIEKINDFINKFPEYYISQYIEKEAEYRVFCMQGRVLCVANKIPGNKEDIAWNVAQGGKFENVKWNDWNLRAVRIALEAFNMTELDFGGVDIIVDKDNNCYVLEINSACSLTSPYRQQCFAKGFDYIIENGKERILLQKEKGNYKKFIHPAIIENVAQN